MLFSFMGLLLLNLLRSSSGASLMSASMVMIMGYLFMLEPADTALGVQTTFCIFHLEKYSYLLIIMTVIILLLSYSSDSFNLIKAHANKLFTLTSAIAVTVIMVFEATSPFMFYLMFEVSVIPIFMMIMGWGYQPEKVIASMSMFLYTLILAAPLITIAFMSSNSGLINSLFMWTYNSCNSALLGSLTMILTLGLLVKIPMYGTHLWLPMAHVEAPVFGSMILAGILLKLGGYGLYKFMPFMSPTSYQLLIMSISLMGFSAVNILCLQMTDMKIVIAYSSVSHMALVIIMSSLISTFVFNSSLLMMLTHAFSSSMLFMVAFYIYNFTNTRNVIMNRGFANKNSILMLMWVCATMASMGTPPFINLISEIVCLGTTLMVAKLLSPYLLLGFIAGSAFHLIMYSSISQGACVWESASMVVSTSASMQTNMLAHVLWLLLSWAALMMI